MNKGILWISLTEESREKLLKLVKPKFEIVHGQHITLKYPALRENYLELIGRKEYILVTGHKSDNEIEAVTVKINDQLPYDNPVPHITVSAGKDVPPVRSNEMLKSNNKIIDKKISFELEGIVEFFVF